MTRTPKPATPWTAAEVRALRLASGAGIPHKDLAADYGCPVQAVSDAVYGVTWPDLVVPAPLLRPGAALNARQVAKARRAVAAGARISDIAEPIGARWVAVARAVHGQTWRGMTDPPPVRPRKVTEKVRRGNGGKLTAWQVRRARELAAAGTQIRDIATVFGVGRGTASNAVYGVTWAGITTPPPLPRPK